jgi:two-component system response regulator YesN
MRQFHVAENQLWIESVLCSFLRDNPPPHQDLPREIQEVLTHIHQHLFDLQLNVRSLKSCCRIRDNNIASRFRYLVGTTIKQYVETLRMEAASHLLRRKEIGIFDIAVSVGYYNLQTFYRAFERRYGCTPAKYRRRLLSATGHTPQQH